MFTKTDATDSEITMLTDMKVRLEKIQSQCLDLHIFCEPLNCDHDSSGKVCVTHVRLTCFGAILICNCILDCGIGKTILINKEEWIYYGNFGVFLLIMQCCFVYVDDDLEEVPLKEGFEPDVIVPETYRTG